MPKKSYRVITPDRYLRVREEPARVTVHAGEDVVARSARAVWLKEGERPEVLYLPREDVAPHRLVSSDKTFDCRWKGRARYFHVDLVDRTLEDVVWGYPDAPDGIAALRERVAFDTSAFAVDIDASSAIGPSPGEAAPSGVLSPCAAAPAAENEA